MPSVSRPSARPAARRLAGLALLTATLASTLAAPRAGAQSAAASPVAAPTAPPAAPACARAMRALADGASAAPPRGTLCVDSLFSAALGARKQFVVWLPPSYGHAPERRYPVVYWLHGLWGDEWNWVRHGGLDVALDALAARGAEVIAVMPDGDDSWYTTWNALRTADACRGDTTRTEAATSYCVPWPHYDDYVARDLVARVDSLFRTIPAREARGIAGLSMGGYGAVALALGYPDVFAAAASHSGALAPMLYSPRPYAPPPRWAPSIDSLRPRWGAVWTTLPLAFGRDTMGWWPRDPGRRAARLQREHPAQMPALFADVGVDDRFLDQNRAFRDGLASLGVPLTYAEWPGGHAWTYWRAHAPESLAWLAARIGAAPATPTPPAVPPPPVPTAPRP